MAPNSKKLKERSEAVQERAIKALELRIAGATYRQIGQELGVSHVVVFENVEWALAERAEQRRAAADSLVQLELERLEKMTLALWPAVKRGDEKAINTMVRVMDRRARLLGMDAPAKTDITSGGESVSFTIKVKDD